MIRGEQLGVEAAMHPPTVRELRFVVRRESFDDPARLVLVREGPRRTTQHALHGTPDALRAIEVEDVGELVGGYETQPAVVEQQAVVACGWGGEDRDAARGKHRLGTAPSIDVVPDGPVHHPPPRG